MKWVEFYWTRRGKVPVKIGPIRFVWTQIIGVQVGRWWLGAIRGYSVPQGSLKAEKDE